MCANWTRCSGRASAFAPASIRMEGPPIDGSGIAIAGRCTSGRRRISSSPAASVAPGISRRYHRVGAPLPHGTTRAEERALPLLAHGVRGLLVHRDDLIGVDDLDAARERLQELPRPVEDRRDLERKRPRARRPRSLRAPDRRPSRRRPPGRESSCATGRSVERLDLASTVGAAGRADVVRPLRLMALRALDERGERKRVRRPPFVAAGLGGLSLRDGHGDRGV